MSLSVLGLITRIIGVVFARIVVAWVAGRARGNPLLQFLDLELNLILILVFHGFWVLFGFWLVVVCQRENAGCPVVSGKVTSRVYGEARSCERQLLREGTWMVCAYRSRPYRVSYKRHPRGLFL